MTIPHAGKRKDRDMTRRLPVLVLMDLSEDRGDHIGIEVEDYRDFEDA